MLEQDSSYNIFHAWSIPNKHTVSDPLYGGDKLLYLTDSDADNIYMK